MKLVPKYGWRITKYNPIFRNEKGAYQKDEWISFSDIGLSFNGEELSFEAYKKTENAYVFTALKFISGSGFNSLKVTSLETHKPKVKKSSLADIQYNLQIINNEITVSDEVLENLCRLVLRDVIWCRLELEAVFYIHFGWDYYMYVGSNVYSEEAIDFGRRQGLFIEEMVSPYISNDD